MSFQTSTEGHQIDGIQKVQSLMYCSLQDHQFLTKSVLLTFTYLPCSPCLVQFFLLLQNPNKSNRE